MIKKWNITIPALTGKEKRKAYVFVPDEAKKYPNRRYPVLYMFDGHNVFFDEDATYGKSWGMYDYMRRTRTPVIIAAVECNHHPDNGRLSEYSPFNFNAERFGKIHGRGRTTMEWLVRSFKPMIDRRFPTMPDREHTFIGGSSMGGLMALYAVTEYNHVFGRAAALSPSIWFSPDKVEHMIRNADYAPGTVVYMDYGSEEMPNHAATANQFTRVTGHLLDKRVMLTCRIVPGGQHCEASWEAQIPYFMNTLLCGLNWLPEGEEEKSDL